MGRVKSFHQVRGKMPADVQATADEIMSDRRTSSDGRPHLRKLSDKSQRELRDLGLVVDDDGTVAEAGGVDG